MIAYIWLQQRLKVSVPQVLHYTNLLHFFLNELHPCQTSCRHTCWSCKLQCRNQTLLEPLHFICMASSQIQGSCVAEPNHSLCYQHCHHHYCDHKPQMNTDTHPALLKSMLSYLLVPEDFSKLSAL